MIALRRRTDSRRTIPGTAEPGWLELCDVLAHILPDGTDDPTVELERLKSRVYRLRIPANGKGSLSFVAKRYDPWLARRNELVLQKWLPALGLEDRAPRLVATAAERHATTVWHVYEDLGETALEPARPDAQHVATVVDLIAELHLRGAGHAVVPECRHFCGSLGASFFVANIRDAIGVLEALAPPRVQATAEQGELRGRLLGHLYRLRDGLPRRVALLETLGGPDTVLHGDLWTTNTLLCHSRNGGGPGVTSRLIDWDHAAVGPISYDLSTFLFRFAKPDRPWILDLYRGAVARAGWHLPATQDLNTLFETAEYARYANRIIWPAVALLKDGAAWGFDQLAEVERWFNALEPALPES